MRSYARAAILLVGVVISSACGADVETSGGSGGAASSSSGPSSSSGVWTECSSPSGLKLCTYSDGGPCPFDANDPECGDCLDDPSFCMNSAAASQLYFAPCRDGDVQVVIQKQSDGYFFMCAPVEAAELLANAGYADRVRYSDWGLWSGDPIPEPATCPTFDGYAICGGDCGGCSEGRICTGRSPLHPYGICVIQPLTGNATYCGGVDHCDPDQMCFRYNVEVDAQAIADEHGWCFPKAECEAMAASLPGGGTCAPD